MGLVVLAVLNFGIYRNERFIETGEEVYFELAPVDPRSLMQGDFMRLNYRIVQNLRKEFERIRSAGEIEIPDAGKIVVRLDERRVVFLKGMWNGDPLAEDERLLHYSGSNRWRVPIGSESFFFEEGQGEAYQKARYGVFKLGKDGRTILRALADENLVRIRPGAKEKTP
ncbi:MAG: GDYXXLXY domain-containing protein [Planctomycetes bacterium]|nr:GDYXXLXY domain-containing protein [Planctomycetota bacterium]